MEILAVKNGSVAHELGISPHSELKAFDDFSVEDILDYEYYNGQEFFTMTVEKDGQQTVYEIEKFADEDLGLELECELSTRQCKNHCIFCFVDQLPKRELRSTLRVKDDDYRHSFISGTYVTLTNLTDKDMERILRLKLSPLYISVHSCDETIRKSLLGVKNCPPLLPQLQRLKEGGIVLHAQIVYCPGYNEDIAISIDILKGYCKSLAIVPVGLTAGHNPVLKEVKREDAEKILAIVTKKQKELLAQTGTRFVFAADEFYIKAGVDAPPYDEYEDADQIENGIGLLSKFACDFTFVLNEIKSGNMAGDFSQEAFFIATGVSAFGFIKAYAERLNREFGLNIRVFEISNDFFGPTVTVAGLITGGDIAACLRGRVANGTLIVPRCCLKEFGDVFLDNMSCGELEKILGVRVKAAGSDGESFVKAFLKTEDK